MLEVVHHRGQGDRSRAQAMLRFAAEQGMPVVLSNAVRYVDALDAPPPTCSTPPAGWFRWTLRHVDRRTAEGYLKSGKEMAEVAEDLVGPDRDAALRLLSAPPGWPSSARSTSARTSASAASAIPSSTSSPLPPSGG